MEVSMPKNTDNKQKFLHYKGKPLVRRGNMIYYGNTTDSYIILLIINETKTAGELEISSNITIQLLTNGTSKERVVKKAERTGLFAAMDIAEYWLKEALEEA